MKIFSIQTTPHKLLLILFFLLTMATCKKEVVEHQYPDELTVQNCEEFVDAPQDIIDELMRKEQAELANHNPHAVTLPDNPSTHQCANGRLLSGSIEAYDGTWRNIGNVRVTRGTYSSYTTSSSDSINYRLRVLTGSSGPKYFSFRVNTSLLNGVTALDKLLVLRHINGTQPFTSYVQLCGADVDGNDVIDNDDAELIEDAILGQIDIFPRNQNVFVTDKDFFERREGEWLNTNDFQNVAGNAIDGPNFTLVKRGDVNGSFNF